MSHPMNPKPIGKAEISKSLKEIETKFGGIVYNFGSNRKNRGSYVGKSDMEIIYQSILAMVEIKVGKDSLSEKQIEYGMKFYCTLIDRAYYLIATEHTYPQIKCAILMKDRKTLHRLSQESYNLLCEEEIKFKQRKLKSLSK